MSISFFVLYFWFKCWVSVSNQALDASCFGTVSKPPLWTGSWAPTVSSQRGESPGVAEPATAPLRGASRSEPRVSRIKADNICAKGGKFVEGFKICPDSPLPRSPNSFSPDCEEGMLHVDTCGYSWIRTQILVAACCSFVYPDRIMFSSSTDSSNPKCTHEHWVCKCKHSKLPPKLVDNDIINLRIQLLKSGYEMLKNVVEE